MVLRDLRQPLALLLLGAEDAQRLGHADRLVRGQERRQRGVAACRRAPAPGCSRPGKARGRRTPRAPSSRARRAPSGRRGRRSGILASRSICSGSTSSSRNSRSCAGSASPFSTAAWSSLGWGWIRSRRKLPRNSSLPKLGSFHSVSRASSATRRAWRSLTCVATGLPVPGPRGAERGRRAAVGPGRHGHACVQCSRGLAADLTAEPPRPDAAFQDDRALPGDWPGAHDVGHPPPRGDREEPRSPRAPGEGGVLARRARPAGAAGGDPGGRAAGLYRRGDGHRP